MIDTDEYSGNFERELCAYITGMTGGCGAGKNEAAYAIDELGQYVATFELIIMSELNDNGWCKPVKIYPTPGWFNHEGKHYKLNEWEDGMDKYNAYQSVAIGLYERPTQEIIDLMKTRAEKYAKICRAGESETIGGNKFDSKFNITGFRLIEEITMVKEERL